MDVKLIHNILDATNMGFALQQIIYDSKNNPVDLHFKECNNLFCDNFGLSTEQIQSFNISHLIAEYSKSQLFESYKKALLENIDDKLETMIAGGGCYYFLQITKLEGNCLLSVIRNITTKVTGMRSSVAAVCENIKACIYLINPENGKILFANQEALDFYGYSSTELMDMTVHDLTLMGIDDQSQFHFSEYTPLRLSLNQLIEIANDGEKSSGHFKQQSKSGEIKDVILNFSYLENYLHKVMFVVVQDRTRIYKMAKTMQENEARYRILFEDAPLGYQTLDKDCIILSVNQEWLNMLGYEKDEVIGKSFFDFVSSESKDILRMQNIKIKQQYSIETKSPIINLTINLIKKDKSKITVALKGRSDYKQMHCNCIITDITPTIQAQEKEKALHKTKNEFLAVISHEVRTPLTTILGLNQLLMKTDLNNIQRDYLHKISNAGSSLLGIINDMLDITKYESGKLDVESLPFDFKNFINNLITVYKIRAKNSGNTLSFDTDDNIPARLIGDPLRLSQILNNILNNAIKFTHLGEITLNTRLIGRSKTDADIQITVRDTGIGMTKEQVEKLFIPFEQADTSFARKYGGSGLGLAISKQLIDLMGGKITVESMHSKGTIFIINLTLPIDTSDSLQEDQAIGTKQIKERLNSIKGKRVLVVEDHKINQKIICDILTFYELNLDVANNGAEAIKKVMKNNYDLIFMDIQMPEMDGLCATKKIRTMKDELKKNTPILAMTAHAMNEEYTKSLESGMNGHITKPISIPVLEENLVKYLLETEESEDSKILDFNASCSSETIDIRMGLFRFHHNADAYKSSLKDFLQFEKADLELIGFLKSGKKEEAMRFLHSIKGVAGNLSLNNLCKASTSLRENLSNSYTEFKDRDIFPFSDSLNKAVNLIVTGEVFNKIDLVMKNHARR